jgi:hypothetical protein
MAGRHGERGRVSREVYQRVLKAAEKEHPRKAAEVLLEGLPNLHRK